VLNGDATLSAFEQAALDGDILVWREVLSEGPLSETISSAEFWKQRRSWISDGFNETEDGYTQKVIDEIAKLNDEYDEINLWFDFDMHCQINQLGVIMLLKEQVNLSEAKLYMISPDDYPDITNLKPIAYLNGEQLEDLYDCRLAVSEVEFYAASNSWELLVKGDSEKLMHWVDTNKYWGNMHWLCAALKAHANRKLINAEGLNSVEEALLTIHQNGTSSRIELYQQFWKQYPIYGMGDKELDLYLASLQDKHPINIHE